MTLHLVVSYTENNKGGFMEKKKVAKQPAKKEPVKAVKAAAPAKNAKPVKKVTKAEPVVVEVETAQVEVKKAEVVKPAVAKKPVTLHQELNLIIALLSLMIVVCFCFTFQGGDAGVIGWELVLKAEAYSGVFKGFMVAYAISLIVDVVLSIRIDTENEIFNIVEKALYAVTLMLNVIVAAVLLRLISKVGIGLIVFLILSIVSVIIKAARIYSQK